jgi:UDP-N-acetylglucosamine--N-acetylmuramyl-(pentapeptide) pyrophosphoryl-undecaprenol N-acetylglucosamine transferase
METELVQREGIAFDSVPAAGVHGVGLKRLPGNIINLLKGMWKSYQILKAFKPDVLLFTGGYVAVPMAMIATRYPSVLFVPDIEPGLALKLITRFADKIAVPSKTSIPYFSKRDQKKISITGYPTKPELREMSKADARKALQLTAEKPVVLVFGGSKGAQTINRALIPLLPSLLQKYQVLHITGDFNWEEVQAQTLDLQKNPNYHVYPYLHEEMTAALKAADLIVSRAGASTIGEYPILGTPSILVPYPFAWRYQKVNADYLANQGAARILPDEQMPIQLEQMIDELLSDPDQYLAMQQSLETLKVPEAARNIAELLTDFREPSGVGGREQSV